MKHAAVMLVVLSACTGGALAQATHAATIWIAGPDEVLANSTFTLDVWGRFESPDFVDGVSAIAGFGMDVICTEGREQIVSVEGPGRFGGGITLESGFPVGPDLIEVRGGQVPNLFGILNPFIDLSNPMHLFSFEVTVGDISHIAFDTMNASLEGGLSFYPDSTDGATIVAPNDAGTSLTFVGWEYVVPGPWTVAIGGLAVLGRRRRAGGRSVGGEE